MHEALIRRAAAESVTTSELVRQALRAFLHVA
jgi:hypothetical protein